MSAYQILVQQLLDCQKQFAFYAEEHERKAAGTPNCVQSNASAEKAKTNREWQEKCADAIRTATARMFAEQESANEKRDILQLETIQDYRFASLVKGKHYAFARGLTIAPTHLPAALDAMKADGFELLCAFGETTCDKIGFLFRIVPTAVTQS